MSEKLLPCPFGEDHEIYIYSFNQDGQGSYNETHGVRCPDCGAGAKLNISINEWNNPRVPATPKSDAGLVEALEFYADKDNWGTWDEEEPGVETVRGCKVGPLFAQAALASLQGKDGGGE